jgi:hypothetical protein
MVYQSSLYSLFHKISGCLIELWLPELPSYKQMIIDHLAPPAHPIEVDYYYDLGEQGPAHQYIIHIDSVDDWCVFGLIKDMVVRTCRLGSGPVGPGDGPTFPQPPTLILLLIFNSCLRWITFLHLMKLMEYRNPLGEIFTFLSLAITVCTR